MKLDFFAKNARDVVLEVEVNPSKAASFEEDYRSIAGSAPVLGVGYQHQPNKWGIEPRIYFNSDVDLLDNFAALGISVEVAERRPYRERWKYRVNNSDFFWGLVKSGYRLGEN